MISLKIIVAALCLSAPVWSVVAQSQPAQEGASQTAPPAGALAVVNKQPVMLADIDPRVGEAVANLETEIAARRKQALEDQIKVLLFEAEARRRRISVDRLFQLEVVQRIPPPTAEEIRAIFEANREQIGVADLKTVRPQIVNYLRNESGLKLTADLAARLRARYPVSIGADINSPTLAPETVVATVAGRTLTYNVINERLKPVIYELRLNVYEAEKQALAQTIYNMLILDEARRRSVPPEQIVRAEITEKLHPPTQEEIADYYAKNKESINGDLAATQALIAQYLEQQQQNDLQRALYEKLSAKADVHLLLTEPEPPVLAISADDDPSRGDINAPVTVVVFTDFQCPVCKASHPFIDEVTQAYGNRVRLVIRDFPLLKHPQAAKAAEAAGAANAQGKYFEYIKLLFEHQDALDVPSLKKYATQLMLNRARFDAELDGGIYAAEVNHDIEDGEQYGVNGTPTIFVNGLRLRDINAEDLRAAIEKALAPKSQSSVAPTVPATTRK